MLMLAMNGWMQERGSLDGEGRPRGRVVAAILVLLALIAAACGGTAATEPAADGAAEVEAEPAVEETETVEEDPAGPEGLEILIADEFTVVSPVAPFPEIPDDFPVPEDSTCESGAQARTTFNVQLPSESARAMAGTLFVTYQRIIFDSADEAAALLQRYGPGNCEATVIRTLEGEPIGGTMVFEDQALDVSLTTSFPSATALISPDAGFGPMDTGLLLIQNDAEAVVIVASSSQSAQVEEIVTALETAAGPYS